MHAGGLERGLEPAHAVLGEVTAGAPGLYHLGAVVLERDSRARLHAVALYLGYELAQKLGGLGVGALDAAGLAFVLAASRVEPGAHAQLPTAALALGLALLELHDGAFALDLHCAHPLSEATPILSATLWTLRVLVPVAYISATAAARARSACW